MIRTFAVAGVGAAPTIAAPRAPRSRRMDPDPRPDMRCRTCGRAVPIDLAACLTGTALWPRCCERAMVFVCFPTTAELEAVVGPLLVSAVTAVLVGREREGPPHA